MNKEKIIEKSDIVSKKANTLVENSSNFVKETINNIESMNKVPENKLSSIYNYLSEPTTQTIITYSLCLIGLGISLYAGHYIIKSIQSDFPQSDIGKLGKSVDNSFDTATQYLNYWFNSKPSSESGTTSNINSSTIENTMNNVIENTTNNIPEAIINNTIENITNNVTENIATDALIKIATDQTSEEIASILIKRANTGLTDPELIDLVLNNYHIFGDVYL